MAEIKKYLDTTALGTLVDQIKAEDAKTLEAAKAYCDGKDSQFEVAGAAATAESNAKAHAETKVNELANGAVKTNTEAIAEIKGDYLKAADKEALQGNIDGVDAKADANAEAIAAINNAETGILKQAKDYADAEDAKVEQMVADLEAYVGEIPEGATATDIVGYVQEKTAGIATDAALGELQAAVDALSADVDVIEADYLKAADKTEVVGKIEAEQARAEGIEAGLASRIKAVEDDYLKAEDKEELVEAIATAKTEAIATVLGEGVDADFDTLKEVADWILSDTTGAAALQTDVATLKEEMDAVEEAVEKAQGEVDALEGVVATKADAQALTDAVADLEEADAGQVERIEALEAKFGGAEGSVEDQIADAKQEAIETAAEDATSKADAAKEAAIAKANELNTAMNTRVEALEAIDHEHANKAELDLIVSGDKAKWDAAEAKLTFMQMKQNLLRLLMAM